MKLFLLQIGQEASKGAAVFVEQKREDQTAADLDSQLEELKGKLAYAVVSC